MSSMDFLSLPVVALENIFSYLSSDEIAKNRLVSRAFNEICSRMLNRGFIMIERRHAMALKSVKAQLPRRESERRYHPLARHCDILTSIETRISMLNMTYSKFIDSGMCCFIPGKVIDEIKRVLTLVETSKTPPRAHEVLQELRDISSMAIEHFDDKIAPAFRKRLHESVAPAPRPPVTIAPLQIRHEMIHLRRRSLLNAKLSLYLASQYKKFYKKMLEYKKVALRQRKMLREFTKHQREQDATIGDLKKRIEECDIKYSELTHTNQAVGGKAITVLPNIKPRKPMIKLPSLSEDDSEPPAKMPKLDEPTPSTSTQILKAKSASTMAKIRGITNEIRHLSNLTKNMKADAKMKRPVSLCIADALDVMETPSKKLKLD
ncbi:F-box only protein 28 isoform X3 [Hyposmocoma kahamanoa]|uniref:F-box only protein 28 isoform X3 n=1 Tax=Hyposmocoma kahamanoa TaxID=1477025 RepID=UPI000E6D8728|nr:F-box only protein 28 isoform X3 [Hyposmocoma kahamanoa]